MSTPPTVPTEHPALQGNAIRTHTSLTHTHTRTLTFVGDWYVGAPPAVPTEHPAVEGALYAGALDAAAHAQVRTQVRAVRVHHVRATVRPPEHRQVQSCKQNQGCIVRVWLRYACEVRAFRV